MQFLIIYVVISTSFPGRGLSQCRVCFKVVNSVERDATAVKSMHCIALIVSKVSLLVSVRILPKVNSRWGVFLWSVI